MTFAEFKQTWGLALNAQQEAAVQAVDGPVLLLAVPGSGKTTVLICRLGYLVLARRVPPESILTMTYTVAATRDMAQRFADLFGPDLARRLEFRTINGVSARIIRAYEQSRGRKAFALISDERKLSGLVGEIARKFTGEFAAESTVKTLRTAITYCKNMQLTQEEIEAQWDAELPVGKIYRAYCAALREKGWMDYDDQMVYAARILRQCPDILEAFQRKYRYLCVDEAQDTSKIQHAIIRLLAGEQPNLFMVGDEDQSIYGFRAAYPEALMSFEAVYPGAKVLLMERNYRSNAAIVEAAGAFIRRNKNRRDKTMIPDRPQGAEIQAIWAYGRVEQYNYLVTVAKGCDRETAVLYRNNDSALPLLDLLDRQGVGCRCRQVEGTFFTHRVVRDVLDIIALSRDPVNGTIFQRIYYKFHAGIPRAAVQKVLDRSQGKTPLFQALAQLPDLYPSARKRCMELHTHLGLLGQEPAHEAIRRIRYFMGYGAYLVDGGGDQGKLDILEALARQEPDLPGLLRRLEELQEVVKTGSSAPDSQFILSTIHASKGLEYDRVILMDVADGILPAVVPDPWKEPDAQELAEYEEERRLFYVGMTRARDHLAVFRFKKPGLHSTFAADIFPAPVRPQPPGPVSDPGYTAPGPKADTDAYRIGTRVFHRSYGPGLVMTRQGDVATVQFDSGEEKRLSLSTAIKRKQLRVQD